MKTIRKGIITNGDYENWNIRICDDRDGETGGYYIYIADGGGLGFDYWFENEKFLYAQLDDFSVNWSGS